MRWYSHIFLFSPVQVTMKYSLPVLLLPYVWRNWCHTKKIPEDEHSIGISKSLNCILDLRSELGWLLMFKSINNLWGHGHKCFFYFSSKRALKPTFKGLLDSWKTLKCYEITVFYRNVDYWTLNSCLHQWIHLLLQNTFPSCPTPKSYGVPLLLTAGFQTKNIKPP